MADCYACECRFFLIYVVWFVDESVEDFEGLSFFIYGADFPKDSLAIDGGGEHDWVGPEEIYWGDFACVGDAKIQESAVLVVPDGEFAVYGSCYDQWELDGVGNCDYFVYVATSDNSQKFWIFIRISNLFRWLMQNEKTISITSKHLWMIFNKNHMIYFPT